MDPDQVGDCVVRGILADSDYIMIHAAFRAGFEQRFEAILAGFEA